MVMVIVIVNGTVKPVTTRIDAYMNTAKLL